MSQPVRSELPPTSLTFRFPSNRQVHGSRQQLGRAQQYLGPVAKICLREKQRPRTRPSTANESGVCGEGGYTSHVPHHFGARCDKAGGGGGGVVPLLLLFGLT